VNARPKARWALEARWLVPLQGGGSACRISDVRRELLSRPLSSPRAGVPAGTGAADRTLTPAGLEDAA